MNPKTSLVSLFVSLAIILATLHESGYDARVIVFTFVFLALARFITVEILVALDRRAIAARPFLSRFCSPPPPGLQPTLVYIEGTNDLAGDWGYFGFVLVPALLAFGVMGASEHGMAWEKIQSQALWAFFYAAIYWVQDLWTRSTIVDFQKERIVNLAYNMENVMVLFFAVIAGGFLYAILHKFHIATSPWVICAPLLLFKQGHDIYHWRKQGDRAL
jgi:hypothetical protein